MDKILAPRIVVFAEGVATRVPPTEFRIAKAGVNMTLNGPYIFDEKAAVSVAEAFAGHGAILPVDYDHLMLDPFAPLHGGKAAGWFKPEVRDGELWASEVVWTPAADRALRDLEYRYMSPAFYTDDEGRMVRLINAALTNLPATHGLDPLVAASERAAAASAAKQTGTAPPDQKGRPMKQLLVALGLSETASEAEGLMALSRDRDERSKDKDVVRELTSAVGAKSASEALGKLTVIVEKSKRVDEADARATKMETEVRLSKASVEIDKKIADGFIRPASKAYGMKLAAKDDDEMFQGWLAENNVKVINTSGHEPGGDVKKNRANGEGTGADGKVTREEDFVCKKLGIRDLAAYRAFKAKNGPVGMAPKDSDESDEEAS